MLVLKTQGCNHICGHEVRPRQSAAVYDTERDRGHENSRIMGKQEKK